MYVVLGLCSLVSLSYLTVIDVFRSYDVNGRRNRFDEYLNDSFVQINWIDTIRCNILNSSFQIFFSLFVFFIKIMLAKCHHHMQWNSFKVELISWIWKLLCLLLMLCNCHIFLILFFSFCFTSWFYSSARCKYHRMKPEIACSNWSTNLLHNKCTSSHVTVDSRTCITHTHSQTNVYAAFFFCKQTWFHV